MIIIEEAYEYKECNICHKRNEVVNFAFQSDKNRSGVAVTLCKDCRKKLYDLIKEIDDYSETETAYKGKRITFTQTGDHNTCIAHVDNLNL